jgi:hypothetical protein
VTVLRTGALLLIACLAGCPGAPVEGEDTGSGSVSTGDATTSPTTGAACEPGAAVCEGDALRVCGDDGTPGPPSACAVRCEDGRCVDCTPGERRCLEGDAYACDDAGTWQLHAACNPTQDLVCEAGACVGACAPEALIAAGASHLGCEFYPVSIAARVGGEDVFGVVVVNPGDDPATVTATKSFWSGAVRTVPPHGSAEIFLPWDLELAAFDIVSDHVSEGAVRLQSDRPVAVVQHSPMLPQGTADSSLLLPVHAWGREYAVASAASYEFVELGTPSWGVFAVVAAEDGTSVELHPPEGAVVRPGGGVAADGAGAVVLARGDVLQVVAGLGGDLTGARVVADRPVQVIGGHTCAQVPVGVDYCDHLEESMLPVPTLGTTHVLVPPVRLDDPGQRAPQRVRVVAVADLTTLAVDPPLDVPSLLVYAGDALELPPSSEIHVLTTDKPVLVAQYMQGSELVGGTGDPSLTLAIPVERFRREHVFAVPSAWPLADLDIVAPAGAQVTIDGAPVLEWTAAGASGHAVAHLRLLPAGPAAHVVTADVPVGASLYSPGTPTIAVSFWHPLGLAFAGP